MCRAQIGLVMLIGLAAKNAILIVEFAKAGFEAGGKTLAEAALEAAKVRLRPILMTSLAFILGCVPLWTAAGAGAISRQVMGTAVIGGMVASSAIRNFGDPRAVLPSVEKPTRGREACHSPVPTPNSFSRERPNEPQRVFPSSRQIKTFGPKSGAASLAAIFLMTPALPMWWSQLSAAKVVNKTPPSFRGAEGAMQQATIADLPWWDIFKDETLTGLVNDRAGE